MGFLGGLIRAGVSAGGGALKGANVAEQTRYDRSQDAAQLERQRNQDALQALLLQERFKPPAPYDPNTDPELLRKKAMREQGLDVPVARPQETRNIDPLSSEGIAARVRLHRSTQDPTPGSSGGAPVKTTADERKGAGFLLRAKKAEGELSGEDGKSYMPTESWVDPIARFLTPKPLEGFTTTERSRNREPSEKAFLSAVLRKDTGAVISDIEYEDGIRQYFERANDSDQQKATKRSNRLNALKELELYGGRAVDPNAPADEATVTPPAQNRAKRFTDANIDDMIKQGMSDEDIKSVMERGY